MSHEIAECVLRKVNKSWKFNSCSTHQPTFDDKSELKVITQQDQLKWCSQKDWNCKAKFVHTSKIIKIGTLTDVRDCCLRTFLFFSDRARGYLIEVSFEIDNFEISRSCIDSNFHFSSGKEDLFCKLSFDESIMNHQF